MLVSPKHFDLLLVDIQPDLCDAWQHAFMSLSRVTIVNGKFQQIREFDCIISPVNSFGLMDGGIDLAIRDFFDMQKSVNKLIEKEFK